MSDDCFEFGERQLTRETSPLVTNSSTVPFTIILQSHGAGFAEVAAVWVRTLVVQLSDKAL